MMDTRTAEPTTVGEMLREEFLKPLNLSQEQLAKAMGVSRKLVSQIVNNQRRISLDEALLLSGLFETSPSFWLNVQVNHDRWVIRQKSKDLTITPIVKMLSAHSA